MFALLGWVIVAVVTAELFWWILGIAVTALIVTVTGRWLWRVFLAAEAEIAACEVERQAMMARADQQHTWALADDPRGTYGDYPPSPLVWPSRQPTPI